METPEMQELYRTCVPGDPNIFRERFDISSPGFIPTYCGLTFSTEPGGVLFPGDWWQCTREPGHEARCVTESFSQVIAVADGRGKEATEWTY